MRTFALESFFWGLLCLAALGPSSAQAAGKHSLKMKLDLSHPMIMHTQANKLYLKIALTGDVIAKTRPPVNLAVVLDRSTSMTGIKLKKAKDATKMVLELLRPNDIFSLVTYDSTVQVLIPATRLTASTKRLALGKIDKIYARGMTALFGGVSKGIAEVKKFLSKKRVNRVILLSDGQANIGPSSSRALGRLGVATARQGISISTIGLGLGYNEDLMTILALKSDGNHGFAKTAADLQKMFQAELGNVLSVVAQRIQVKIEFGGGITPVRVLDNTYTLRNKRLNFRWNQLYSRQHKFIIIEATVAKGADKSRAKVATVRIQYTNMNTHKKRNIQQSISVTRTKSSALVQRHLHRSMMIHVTEAIGNERMRKAMRYRDKGQVEKARNLLKKNSLYLKKMGKKLKSKKLFRFSLENSRNAKTLSRRRWNYTRKRMRRSLYKRRSRQTW